jgi:hypothetical protein
LVYRQSHNNIDSANIAQQQKGKWPAGFDLVILGGNCFYELATSEEQEICISKAFESLNNRGSIFVDNDHMENDLDGLWIQKDIYNLGLSGVTADGIRVESLCEVESYDLPNRISRLRRKVLMIQPDGEISGIEYMQQKHPVSKIEVENWLIKAGFEIKEIFGNTDRQPYTVESERAIFIAQKR